MCSLGSVSADTCRADVRDMKNLTTQHICSRREQVLRAMRVHHSAVEFNDELFGAAATFTFPEIVSGRRRHEQAPTK